MKLAVATYQFPVSADIYINCRPISNLVTHSEIWLG